MKTIKELAIDHAYYCSTANYFSNEAGQKYNTWPEFYSDFHDADIDYNLIFRWDIKEHTTDNDKGLGTYWMEIFFIQQRKGIFFPVVIHRVFDEDVETIVSLLKTHAEYLTTLWKPIIL